MKFILPCALGLSLFALTACDITKPVAVVGDGMVFRGTSTASMTDGGWFQVTNGNVTCRGRYPLTSEVTTITFPVSCTNGLKGVGTATYHSPTEGGGSVTMQDGSVWKFIFGNAALNV